MPVRKRNLSRRTSLDPAAQAWLRGEKSGFFEFKPHEELATLWEEHGDASAMFYRCGMSHPISRKSLTANENEWLASGIDDEHGANSYFIATYYTTDDKQSLWDKRGDHESFLWESGMRRPVSIVAPA